MPNQAELIDEPDAVTNEAADWLVTGQDVLSGLFFTSIFTCSHSALVCNSTPSDDLDFHEYVGSLGS